MQAQSLLPSPRENASFVDAGKGGRVWKQGNAMRKEHTGMKKNPYILWKTCCSRAQEYNKENMAQA